MESTRPVGVMPRMARLICTSFDMVKLKLPMFAMHVVIEHKRFRDKQKARVVLVVGYLGAPVYNQRHVGCGATGTRRTHAICP